MSTGTSWKWAGGAGGFGFIVDDLKPLEIEIAKLAPDPENARTHDRRNVETIKESFRQFGQRLPIVVQQEGMVVRAGNARLLAAKELGWAHIAAVIVDDDDQSATAYALADNRTAELAEWDEAVLAELLAELQTQIPDQVGVTGFTAQEVDALVNKGISAAQEAQGFDPGRCEYAIVFDDQSQLDTWFDFLRALKSKHPDFETAAARVDQIIIEGEYAAAN